MSNESFDRVKKLRRGQATPYAQGTGWSPTLRGPLSKDTADSQAMVSNALAEKEVFMTAGQAERLLRQGGENLSDGDRRKLLRLAQGKSVDQGVGERLLNWVDAPRRWITTAIADVTQLDQKAGQEISASDWWNVITGDVDELAYENARTFGDDGRLSGSALLRAAGAEEREDLAGKVARGISSFVLEVGLDPLTYVSFGTLGVGKAAALKTATGTIRTSADNAVAAAVRGLSDDAVEMSGRELLQAAVNESGDELAARLAREADQFWDEAAEEAADAFIRQVDEVDDAALQLKLVAAKEVADGDLTALRSIVQDRPEVGCI